jgi:hypothetical protein
MVWQLIKKLKEKKGLASISDAPGQVAKSGCGEGWP